MVRAPATGSLGKPGRNAINWQLRSSAGLATHGVAAKPSEDELSAIGVFVLAGICSPPMPSHSSRTKKRLGLRC